MPSYGIRSSITRPDGLLPSPKRPRTADVESSRVESIAEALPTDFDKTMAAPNILSSNVDIAVEDYFCDS